MSDWSEGSNVFDGFTKKELTCECCGKEFNWLIYNFICDGCFKKIIRLGIETLKSRENWAGK